MQVKVQIIDTSASHDEYDEMRPLIYPHMDIFFVFFAIDKPLSYLNVINKWVPEIERKVKNPLKILIGTDCDLRVVRFDLISRSEGQELAKLMDFTLYMEISSRINDTLKDMFENMLKAAFLVPKKRSWLGNVLNTDLL
jgi:GTPase SAR1 family protein